MTDLKFEVNATWSGVGVHGEGDLKMADKTVLYSSPAEMGGKSVGVSPEDLLIGAVTTCYSGTLFAILTKRRLPVENLSVRAEGIVTGFPPQTNFSKLIVYPTIIGGDSSKQDEYEKAATIARDKCFIGKSIAGNIDYQVGKVQL
ncbi:OsmC family protein [Mesobacillus maritimus]|uniref:OsmC family protein n=1 Tax=Mesobacillus maritimus TaxID=1643336 RepID=UPI00384EE7AB